MKIPFTFAARLVFRLILPGLLLSILLYPITNLSIVFFNATEYKGGVLGFEIVLFGWLILLLDMRIYMIYEGRRHWPKFMWNFFYHRERRRLVYLWKRLRNNESENRTIEYQVKMSLFPLAPNGRRIAFCPTRLGNLITEYEQYPGIKYGADGVFFWYRIWMILPKDIRDVIDEQQALVDGTIYTSFVGYVSVPVLILYAIARAILSDFGLPIVSSKFYLILAMFSGVSSYLLYRASLVSHANYGEYIKAMFDQFIWNINIENTISVIADKTDQKWVLRIKGPLAYKIVWRYLRWHEFRPLGCQRSFNIESSKIQKEKY